MTALPFAFGGGGVTGGTTEDLRIEVVQVGAWEGSRMRLLNWGKRKVIVIFQVTSERDRVRGLLTSDLSNAEIDDLLARYESALR